MRGTVALGPHGRTGRQRTMRRVLLTLAMMVVLVSAATRVAEASGWIWYNYLGSGIHIRTGPSSSNTSLGHGSAGQGPCVSFTVSGQNVNGNPYWNYHRNTTTGVTGYSSDYYMAPRELYPWVCAWDT